MDILIYDEIDNRLASEVAEKLRAKPREAVSVRLNSYGGSAADGFAIYNALKSHAAPVTTFVEGIAYSAATLIACAGLWAAALALTGCGATPRNPDTAGASGVTIYGTVDAGVGRVRQ